MNEKIKCLECGHEMGVITSQHLKICCGLTIKEYKEKHPTAETVSEKVKLIRQNNAKTINERIKKVYCIKCGKNYIEKAVSNHWEYICDECKYPTYPGKIYLPDKDLVVCQICFQGFEQITTSHMKMHNIAIKEYKEQFPKAWVTNKAIREQRSIRHMGEGNPTKRKDVKKKMSDSMTFTSKEYMKRYPWIFPTIEPIRDYLGILEVTCKQCGKWFHPNQTQRYERIRALTYGSDGEYYYCSHECKNKCPLYRLNPEQVLKSPSEAPFTAGEYDVFRQEVLKRQRDEYGYNFCERCEAEENLHVHHEKPQKTHPIMALDPDNGIVLCIECHLIKTHIDSCSTNNLAKC